jgi:hypothetical protein
VEAKEQERLPPGHGLTEIGEEKAEDAVKTVCSTPGPIHSLGERVGVGPSAIVVDRIRMPNSSHDGVVVAAHLGVWNEHALRNREVRYLNLQQDAVAGRSKPLPYDGNLIGGR